MTKTVDGASPQDILAAFKKFGYTQQGDLSYGAKALRAIMKVDNQTLPHEFLLSEFPAFDIHLGELCLAIANSLGVTDPPAFALFNIHHEGGKEHPTIKKNVYLSLKSVPSLTRGGD